MKLTFYPRLALSGIRKNRRLFAPYILAAAGICAVYYILYYLSIWQGLEYMRGGGTARSVLHLGVYVVALFGLVFLFYSNSFIVRRRYREFGLYSVLGMNKRNISAVLAWETLICALASIFGGVALGAALSKLAELCLVKMLGGEPDYALSLSLPAVKYCLLFFGGSFLAVFLAGALKLRLSSSIELVRSESVGEKPPKANIPLGVGGVLLLIAAYYTAVSIDNPVEAVTVFFYAVVAVIIATYLIFVSGSVLLCRVLQRNKKYYYAPRHFVSVSSMVYRMKRNGAGLASVCVLATMVLVTVSSTTCLYFGAQDAADVRYPRDINVQLQFRLGSGESDFEQIDGVRDSIVSVTDETERLNLVDYRRAALYGEYENGVISNCTDENLWSSSELFTSSSDTIQLVFIPLEDYNRSAGTNIVLGDGEALACGTRLTPSLGELSVGDMRYNVTEILDALPASDPDAASTYLSTLTLVVNDFDSVLERLRSEGDNYWMYWNYAFDTGLDSDGRSELYDRVNEAMYGYLSFAGDSVSSLCSRDVESAEYTAMFGGLFFLGLMLSVLFSCAAALIIYYKQLCEGYEDAPRFGIMQKLGMTRREIRRSINSQLLTVFYMPLLLAGLHMCFAFPFIRKMFRLFGFFDTSSLVITTLLTGAVFALLYAEVYRRTSLSYYKIVSG